MRRLVFFISGIFLISCQSLPQRSTASVLAEEKTGLNYIIMVHGFNGDSDNFGEVEKVLMPHLKQLRPQTQFKLLKFSYPTGSDKDVFEFAYKNLSQFLHKNIPHPTMNDRITFVGHSQGGIVISVWKAATQYGLVVDPAKYPEIINDKIYAQITEQVITVGTPFWGSNQAQLAASLNILNSRFDRELQGLVFNSELILWLREIAIQISKMSEGERNDDQTIYTNIAGIMPNERNKVFYQKELIKGGLGQIPAGLARKLVSGLVKRHSFSSEKINSKKPDRFESDLTALVPSTRSHFYFAEQDMSCSKDTVHAEQFRNISLFNPAQYILTEGLHSSLLSLRTRSIVDIPAVCAEAERCTHPTYRYILKLLAACDKYTCAQSAQQGILDKMFKVNEVDTEYNKILSAGVDLQGFSLDLNLQVPADYDLPEKYYRDLPYTENEEVINPREQRDLRDKKLIRALLHLDEELLTEDLKSMLEIKLVRRREGSSGVSCWGQSEGCVNMNVLKLHITGWIKPKSLDVAQRYQTTLLEKYQDGLTLPFTIQLPSTSKYNFKKSTLFAKLHPGYSTFVKLNYLNATPCAPWPTVQNR